MLYAVLKQLMTFLVYVFYRRIFNENTQRVPSSGPVLLASNHPNTMMDPLLVALGSGRNPHFLGKSTLFKTRIAKWFFNKVHVLPVYRRQDAEAEMGKNAEVFEKCYQSLEQGNALVIMPEGMSQMDGTLHELKTGIARIGLGAEARNDFKLGVTIVPAGINYSSPTEFFSDVHCRFGRPIELKDYQALYEKDPYEAVYAVTEQVREALAKLTTTVENSHAADTLKGLEKIYKMELAVDLGLDDEIRKHDFSVTRGMADAIDWFYREHPNAFRKLDSQLSHYLAKIEGLELRDDLLSTAAGQRTFARRTWGLVGVLVGFPFYAWGLINNFLPYHIPAWVIRILKPTVEYLSTFKLISGFVAFTIFYAAQSFLVYWLSGSGVWTLIYFLSLVPTGRFALYYRDTMTNYRQHLRLFTLLFSRKALMLDIIQERNELMQALDGAKHEFMNRKEEGSGPSVGMDDSEA